MLEDEEIVRLYWARDQLAVVETQRKYTPLCGSIAMNILQNREDSEEFLNDTWYRAWNTMPPKRPGSLAAYLGRIVRNLALDLYRKYHAAKRYAGLELLLSELEECVPVPGQGTFCSEEELSGIIDAWLRELPGEDRQLFLRRYWRGEGVQEMARAAGVRANQISLRLFRLRGKLRQHLEKEGVSL